MSEMINKIEVLYNLKRYEEVLSSATPLIASSSEDLFEAYQYIIMALASLERYDEALGFADKALSHMPNEAIFLYFKSLVLYDMHKPKQALELIKQVLSIEPNRGTYHHLHAKILVVLSRYVEAKRAIDKALSLESTNPDFELTHAMILYYLDNTSLACELITNILSRHPNHTETLSLKSKICESNLGRKASLLKNILFHSPFSTDTKEEYESIRLYYQIAPLMMGIYLTHALGAKIELWNALPHATGILFLLSTYIWRDWRLAMVFYIFVFILMGDVTWSEWYVVPFAALIYYAMGRITGTIAMAIFDKIKEIINRGKKWLKR